MKIVLASRNRKKIAEMLTLLRAQGGALTNVSVLSLDDIGYEGDIVETGETFRENAFTKASVPASMGYIGIADDSGLVVDALDGAPGVYSARYAGEPCDDEKNNQKLLAQLENVPNGQRTAHYTCTIACMFPDGRQFSVDGICQGTILREYHGKNGFGYDPLFYYPPFEKTFAEIVPAEKNKVSHRANAIVAFAKKLETYLKPPVVLTSKTRAYLRSLAHTMQPIFQIGKCGISGEIYYQIDRALEARELIKVNVLENCAYTAREAADAIALATASSVVAVTGRRFVLYRESESNRKILL